MSGKQEQILNLHSFYPSQVRTVVNNERFEIPMIVGPMRVAIPILITLPDGFPDAAPVLKVSPAVIQPWVDREMRIVGHETLSRWSRNNMLGKLLKDVEIEFSLRPPMVTGALNAPAITSSPTAQLEFLEVSALNAKQLKAILEDDGKFEDFFSQSVMVQETLSVQDDLFTSNYEIASIQSITSNITLYLNGALERNMNKKEELSAVQDRFEELQAILELEEAELCQFHDRHVNLFSVHI